MLRLNLPSSPLLSSSSSDTVFSPAVRVRCAPPPTSVSYTCPMPRRYPTLPSSRPSTASSAASSLGAPLHPARSLPEITVTRPLSELPPVKPISKPRPPPARVPSRQVIALLDLLDKIDRDMALEVQRVKDNIKDAHAYVNGWRKERNACREECERKRAWERVETKGLDSDFWLGV